MLVGVLRHLRGWEETSHEHGGHEREGRKVEVGQMLILIKGENASNTIIVRDFNIPLTPVERSPREKMNNKIKVLNVTMD